MREHGLEDVPVVVGGIIPSADAATAPASWASPAVFTPKDFGLTEIMAGIVAEIRRAHGLDEAREGPNA